MKNKSFLSITCLVFGIYPALSLAFPCYITMVKDNCWANYTVTVNVIDASKDKSITTIVVPEGKSWTRSQFECQPKQSLMFQATFDPVFWKKDEGKILSGKRYWFLPEAITGKTVAWNMNVCYSADFAEVPLPPDASGKCQCDMTGIPPVEG